MDTELFYIAKDGRRFTDPFKCEEYEKMLGKQPGTVGYAKDALRNIGEQKFINGHVAVHHVGECHWVHYITTCLDDYIEDYVNVNNLPEEKRWITSTIADAIKMLDGFDESDECVYMLTACDQRDFKSLNSVAMQHNQAFWDKGKECEEKMKKRLGLK